MNNLVSVIMNCRNGEKYLNESLATVLNQTFLNWELIFVDNMSDDQSKKIFFQHQDKRLKYFNTNSNLNLGAARQFALDKCEGEFVAFLDTDDLWEREKLENQIKYFTDPQVGMVISNTIFFSDQKKKIFYKKKPPTGYVLNELLNKYFISLETLVCRKSFMDKISFKFDEGYTMISDLDLALRLAKVSKLEYSPNILAKWRIHKASETWIKKNKFFSEKLLLFSKLQNDIKFNNDNETKKYLNFFKNNTYYNIVYHQIENNFKKNEILNNLKKINNIDVKYILTFLLVNLPFKENLIKLIRKLTQLSPK